MAINPPGPLNLDGKQYQVFTSTYGSGNAWSTSGGSIVILSSTQARWTPPNITGEYTLANGHGDTVTITVIGVMPPYWEGKSPMSIDKMVLVFEPKNGPDQTRTLSPERYMYQLGSSDIDEDKMAELRIFWYAHYPGKAVYLDDPDIPPYPRRFKIKLDSKLQFKRTDNGGWEWNGAVKEQWPYGGA